MAKTDASLGEVILKDVRLSFAALFDPKKPMESDDGTPGQPKYGCNLLMSKTTPEGIANFKKCQAAAAQVKADKWPKTPPKLKAEKVFLRDGDLEDYDGFAGMFYASCNNPDQPVLVDRIKDASGKWKELTKANGGPKRLYSGARVNAIIRIWAQDNKWGKRINASIESVQFFKDGDPFSGHKPVDPNEKFADVEEQDDGSIGDEQDDNDLI